ncbi:MAG: hypothetical protein LC689_22530 [Myxococcales bacterium]|nr:hypothetical protein [Myxococcales bacterium]
MVNIDVIGSEEGGWLYGAYRWQKDPVVSIGLATNYQSQALKNAFGSLTDLRVHSADVYLNLPQTEAAELVAEVTAFSNNNGTGSANSGLGIAAAVGYRFGRIAPYVAYDYFNSYDCDLGSLSAAQILVCNGKPGTLGTTHSADSRNFKAGLNFFFNKNLNHVNLEFQLNHGTSAYGPLAITNGNAAYVPLALDPAVAGGPRRAATVLSSLAQPVYKSFLVHWNYIF